MADLLTTDLGMEREPFGNERALADHLRTTNAIDIGEAVAITGLSARNLRDIAPRIPGAHKGLTPTNTPVWRFDEALLRGWVAGTVQSNVGAARRRALDSRFPCSIYMGTLWTVTGRPDRIYFAQAGEHVKIGLAFNPKVRVKELQVGNPLDIQLKADIAGGRQAEMYLHEFYATERVRGEWFHASERLVAYIERLNPTLHP